MDARPGMATIAFAMHTYFDLDQAYLMHFCLANPCLAMARICLLWHACDQLIFTVV